MLFRAAIEVQDGEHSYIQHRWIQADNLQHAQEIGEKFAELCNRDQSNYRGYRFKTVDPKPLIEKRIRQRDHGLTENRVEELLEQVKDMAAQ